MIVSVKSKSLAMFAKVSATALLFVAASAANASLVTIPAAGLKASPGVYTAGGYYTNSLGQNIVTTGGGNAANIGLASGRNDDGYQALSLGFNVTFFGNTYNSLFINNNGSVSFGSGVAAFEATGPTGVDAPIISPFFGDVDTRNAGSGVVRYNLQQDQLVVTWDNVGYFSSRADLTNSFQLVLRSDSYNPAVGEGVIGFFYKTMAWEKTGTSQLAAVGFGNGNGDGQTIAGSLKEGMNAVVQNKYIWFDAKLDTVPPITVPEPSGLALLAIGLLGAGLSARRKTQG